MRTTYDFAPLWRSTIGFDRLFDLVDAAQQQAGTEDNYPPCNVERVREDRYQISLAVAGFSPDEIETWGFGIAGKENKVSVACYRRLDQIASHLQGKYELHPVKAARRDIEARVWSRVHDHPTLKAWLSRSGGAYDIATFKKLEGQPNWTMEWNTDDQPAKAAFERIVRSVQTQIELE
jgi:hypothetical protein